MNELYRKASILDGHYDGEKVWPNRRRRYFNRFVECLAYYFFINHLIVFVTNHPTLNRQLVHMKLNETFGHRFISFCLGLGLFTINTPISLYRSFSKDPQSFQVFNFWFCSEAEEMQRTYLLSAPLANKQVRLQNMLMKIAAIWHQLYTVSLASIIGKFAVDDLTIEPLGFLFAVKLLLYPLLIFLYRVSMLRGFLMLCELNVGAFYLSGRLRTVIDKVALQSNPKKLNRRVRHLLQSYNLIIRQQQKINRHCGTTLIFAHVSNLFTIILPVLCLYVDRTQTILLSFYLSNYLLITMVYFFPMILSNSYFTNTVSSH